MGWFIINLIVITICIGIIKSYDIEADEVLTFTSQLVLSVCNVITFICIIIHVGMVIIAIDTYCNTQTTILKYENLKIVSNELKVPSDETLKKIIDMNEKIYTHRIYANNFMTSIFYSEKIGELPLLETPKIMKNGVD